jgi:hypothetical protein
MTLSFRGSFSSTSCRGSFRSTSTHLVREYENRHSALLAHIARLALGLQRLGVAEQALRRVAAPVEQHVFHKLQQLLVHLLVHVLLDLSTLAARITY